MMTSSYSSSSFSPNSSTEQQPNSTLSVGAAGTAGGAAEPGVGVKKMDFWTAAFESMLSPPQIDYEKLATLTGYKSAAVARAMYQHNKKKLLTNSNNLSNNSNNSTSISTSTVAGLSPSKRGRGRPRGTKAMNTTTTAISEDGGNNGVQKKKGGRTSGKAGVRVKKEKEIEKEEGEEQMEGGNKIKEEMEGEKKIKEEEVEEEEWVAKAEVKVKKEKIWG